MLVVHSCIWSHLLAQGSSLKFSSTFRLLSPVNVAVLPLNVVVVGLLHEALRDVLHLAIGPSVPRCEPCHCDETAYENGDSGDGASRRRANSGGQAVVTSDEIRSVDREVGHLVQKDPVGDLISNSLVKALAALGFLWVEYQRELARASPGPSGWCLGDTLPFGTTNHQADGKNGCSCGRCVTRSGLRPRQMGKVMSRSFDHGLTLQ